MTIAPFTRQSRPDRSILRLTGDGVLAFLNNLLTPEVVHLPEGQGAYGALLSPQGKILHDLFVIHRAGVVFIDCAAVQAAGLMQKLMLYRLRAKIDIQHLDDLAVAVSPAADLQGLCYPDPRLPEMGYRAVIGKASVDEGMGYEALRLAHGIADSVADIGSGVLFVHEANLDQLNGVHFAKGCYVGQEIVSRMHHRGTARTRILPVGFDGSATTGGDVESGGIRLGQMLSSDQGRGLALLRLDKLAEVTEPVMTAGLRLHVQKPTWAKFDLALPEIAQ
jgi:tRNA-modifying protein YgfZ